MSHLLITQQDQFEELCEHLRQSRLVGFDTEFVAEYHYRPKLCLLQLATDEQVAAVDPFAVADLSSWWSLMVDGETTVIIHGGREEIRFCHAATGKQPGNLVDVQLAEGLLSRGYPISYTNLVQRVLGERLSGHETRTDWRRRPLTERQVEYALDDVRHLPEIWRRQQKRLEASARLPWAMSECQRFIDDCTRPTNGDEWRRLSGVHKLNRRSMAIARELYDWRDSEAARQDRPPRSLIRDDLLIEIAKRRPQSVHDLQAVRGMNRRDYVKLTDDLLAAVSSGTAIPEEHLPAKSARPSQPAPNEVLVKILGIALAQRCAERSLSMTLVGTSADLNQLVSWHLAGEPANDMPRLLEGWRGEVCGSVLRDVLAGRISMRVADAFAEAPLEFTRIPADGLA